MLYKPKYCCNCGERIERVVWKPFASRKFCELCETEYKFEEMLPKIAALILVVFGLWGFGSLFFQTEEPLVVEDKSKVQEFQKNTKRSLKADNFQSGNSAYNLSDKQNTSNLELEQTTPNDKESQQNLLNERSSSSSKSKSAKNTQKTSDMPVYFCGAETKKGTPCSRPMKGGGRCWQHKGREAMLPAKDLLISGK